MITTVNPATGDILRTYQPLTKRQIDDRLEKGRAAYARWRLSSLDERTALLHRLADVFSDNADLLARTCTLEMGKTLASAKAEVEKCCALFRHLAATGPSLLAPMRWDLASGGHAEGHWLPQGIVLAVMPWNFPYWQVVRFLAPMVLAGNAGVLKHASSVQGCAHLIEDMMVRAGAPNGLFQNLCIGSDAVPYVLNDARVIAASVTGSEGAGSAVAAQAGKLIKKVVLELGGSDPFIVMPSADLDAAVAAAVTARIQNTGQSCICGKRMIVHAAIYDTFRDRFCDAMRAIKSGDPFAADTDMGPLSSIAQRDTVLEQLRQAQADGATLLVGGEALPGAGAYMSAGVLVDVDPASATMVEEIFGPVAMLFEADDIDHAIALANAIPFGLGSSVWTCNDAERERFVRDIAAGMTAVNQVLVSAPEAPFGGVKRSGHGRELSQFGLHEFMNLKTVMLPG